MFPYCCCYCIFSFLSDGALALNKSEAGGCQIPAHVPFHPSINKLVVDPIPEKVSCQNLFPALFTAPVDSKKNIIKALNKNGALALKDCCYKEVAHRLISNQTRAQL